MSTLAYDERAPRELEALYAGPDIGAQRRGQLELLHPAAGERVLDLGRGPGFLTRSRARAVGLPGRTLGLDTSRVCVALAARRIVDLPRAEARVSGVRAIALERASLDLVACVQVLAWVAEVDTAPAEIARFLVPVGRALRVATDWP